jgi:mannan endo-1,4-beta-mannosidase
VRATLVGVHAWTLAAVVALGACGAIDEDGDSLGGAGKADSPDGETASCTDVAPGDAYSCSEQVGWGKCGEPWMDAYCDRSCGRCSAGPLIDPAATPGARALMDYLAGVYTTAILSGQQKRADADYMEELTGRYPAVVGFDLMDYSPSRVERGSSSAEIEDAIDWSSEGGIVTVSWHWNAPADLVDSEEWPWWKGFYTQATTFDVARAMYERDSIERQLIIRDIDAIAEQLARLRDAGVPVLWRPVHEASGGWFWWGARGPGPHQMLWRLLYDRLVNHHQLHNLIWVWNGQDPAWYPGDVYVDIIAEDIYDDERDYNPQEAAYLEATRYTTATRLVALSETGTLLDPSRLASSAARWSWFMLWSGDFARAQTWNEDAMKRQVYASDFVITRDELPPLGP